jgi:hypothetical protein
VVEVLINDESKPIEYFSCPVLYIPPKVYDFYTRYSLLKKNLVSARDYGKEDVYFIEATGYYEKWLSFYESKKRPLNV